MRRELIPLVVAFALASCTLDHAGLGPGGVDVPVAPDHPAMDVEGGTDVVAMDAEAGLDAEAGFDAETGTDVPVEPVIETGVDVQTDLVVVDTPVPVDTATTCGATAQSCCTAPATQCASTTDLCLTNDTMATSCAPCGGPGEPCCPTSTRCSAAGFTCQMVAIFGFYPALICLDAAATAGNPGTHCGGGMSCSADSVCLLVADGSWCFRCGERGGFCCAPASSARCVTGMCNTAESSTLPFCR